jgi:CTP:molybdopterin cytidylyltransferase MocA
VTTATAGVLLAAGRSRRFGRDKRLLPFRGSTLIETVAAALAAATAPRLVVLGPGDEVIAASLETFDYRIVVNPAPETGLGASLALAAGALAAEAASIDGLIVALADQPLADVALFSALVAAGRTGGGWAACDYGAGARGVPARLPVAALARLADLAGDRGARDLLDEHRAEIVWLPFPGGAFDVDTEADYARLPAPPSG